ncbi:hypothetical protein [Actinomycetospora lutea]|uniref:hypothetical protein n=1 Tax=Actinomycetospora lutea TaxID=663604 RepID=UPI0023651667|nr:hypothetical protein [Actinomycetospora lutea]
MSRTVHANGRVGHSRHRQQPRLAAWGQDRLSLLVRADVRWVRWGPLNREPEDLQPPSRHHGFLRDLLGLNGGPITDAALLMTPDHEGVRAVAPTQSTELAAWLGSYDRAEDHEPEWIETPAALEAQIDAVVDGLETSFRALRERADATTDALTAALNRYACRAYFTLELPDDPAVSIVVDLRFRWHQGVWLYVTTYLWSSQPRSPRHAPQNKPRSHRDAQDNGAPSVASLSHYSRESLDEVFTRARRVVDDMVAARFIPAAAVVLCNDASIWRPRRYEPPQFWVATCTGAPASSHVTPCDIVDDLCHGVLDARDAGSCLVTRHDVVAGPRTSTPPIRLTVFRRLVPGEESEAPRYVVVPDRGARQVDQEDAVRELLHRLTVEDTENAVDLLDHSTELGVNDGLVRIYEVVAERASSLWDQLAMHLLSARGRTLERVHSRIELLHVGLLQGIADLDYMARKAHADARALDLIDPPTFGGVDERFHAAGPAPGTELGASLRRGGYIDPTRRWAREVVDRADRVRGSFTALHAAIANAFDEHRVRGTDRLGRLGLLFAGVLALTGLATESWAKVLDWLIPIGDQRRAWIFFTVTTAVVIIVLGSVARWLRRKLGSLGTDAQHDRRYEMVRSYLGACRSERLAYLWSAWGTDAARWDALWDAEDQHLAVQCAAVIDDALGHEGGLETNDLEELGTAIEQWVIAAMFVSERPRAFWHQPLPRLTFLYRFFPVFTQCFPATTEFPPLVSDADFMLALGTIAGPTSPERQVVVEWGQGLAEAESARDALRAIERTGICVGLDREGWRAVVQRMRDDCVSRPPTPSDISEAS